MIIDCHCHAGRGAEFWNEYVLSEWLVTYVRQAQAAGISRTVLFAPLVGDYRRANRRVAQIIRRHPGRFIGFAFVDAIRNRGHVMDMLEEFILGERFCGIKCHRHDAPLSEEICEAARTLSVPLLYDPMGRIEEVERCARDFPEVNFIIPHFGTFMDQWSIQQRFIDQLVHFPNVYTDTSGVRRFDLIQSAVERAGSKKVLFGSDGPWLHAGVELTKVQLLNLADAERRDILSGNILRLISSSLMEQRAAAA
jgi:predicted TIM-barrel fold metal-dependent hydrolase